MNYLNPPDRLLSMLNKCVNDDLRGVIKFKIIKSSLSTQDTLIKLRDTTTKETLNLHLSALYILVFGFAKFSVLTCTVGIRGNSEFLARRPHKEKANLCHTNTIWSIIYCFLVISAKYLLLLFNSKSIRFFFQNY